MKYFIYILLLYFTGAFELFGSIPLLIGCHYLFLAIGLGAFIYQLLFRRNSIVTLFIGLYCILFPLYASYQSHIIFGQSYFMGIASLRYLSFILIGFFLYNIKYDYLLLLKQINKLNLFIAGASIIAFFVFGINHVSIQRFLVSTNAIEIVKTEDLVKGFKLTTCSQLMILSYIYYLICIIKYSVQKKYWIPFLILMCYLIFVHKGRQPLVLIAIIYAVYYIRMNGFTLKRVVLGILPVIALFIIVTYSEQLFNSILESTKWENSIDPSTLARISSIDAVSPYIRENPILGFGNLSSHFKDEGFHTFFGGQFYLGDIGIWGTLARGGIVLLLIYAGLYFSLYKKSREIKDGDIRSYMRYMLLTFLILLVLLNNDTLYSDGCLCIALLFYPLFGKYDPNIFIQNTPSSDGRIHYHC